MPDKSKRRCSATMVTKLFVIGTCICAMILLIFCSMVNQEQIATGTKPQAYQVGKLTEPMAINADWDKRQWRKTKPLDIALHMGAKPEHQPKTQAKVLYDDENIYVIFRVEDRYVRAVVTKYQGPVCRDSCVEFFFTPGSDTSKGYFNVETNCIGNILCYHQILRGENVKELEAVELAGIEIVGSFPRKIIDPEKTEPVTWTLEYRLPIEIFEKYAEVTRPRPGVKWRANFYKCADQTSHPHWLTWSFVGKDKPDFHRPEYFGTLEFAE